MYGTHQKQNNDGGSKESKSSLQRLQCETQEERNDLVERRREHGLLRGVMAYS
jgi:hypothetical protein